MKTLIAILGLIILAGAFWYFYQNQYPSSPETGIMMEEEMPGAMMNEVLVEMTPAGFVPQNLTINAGDTVKLVNRDTKNRWPASGVHPTHQLCPGFDALRGLKRLESYSFTFLQKKECPMHDHLAPSLRGKITVQ